MLNMKNLILVLVFTCTLLNVNSEERKLTVYTVATERTDGYERFSRSLDVFGLEVVTLGLGEPWQGGDMNYPAGGWKVNLLKKELAKTNKDGLMMFTDSYDVIFAAGKESILGQYDKMGKGIVFGAEGFCWPDVSLKSKYPKVEKGRRFLNSGGFIGSVESIRSMLEAGGELGDTEDDQLFYTKIYLDKELRDKFSIKLDHRAELFQNINGETEYLEVRFAESNPYIYNLAFDTMPMVFHGNGPSKLFLDTLGNYIPGNWDSESGCVECWRDVVVLKNLVETPRVVLAVFIEQSTPFMDEFWEKLVNLNYDKSAVDLLVHNKVEYHENQVSQFVEYWRNGNEVETYNSIEFISFKDGVAELEARNRAIELCAGLKCDYLFVVDSVAHLDNSYTLQLLIEQNRQVVAPMMIRAYSAWSNFWGTLSSDGFYARSLDYMELVRNDRRGLWNVPYISSCYLIAGSMIQNAKTRPTYSHPTLDPDMAFAKNIRDNKIFLHVTNRVNFGHLINNENFSVTHFKNELWEMERNRYDWEIRYLHANYSMSLESEFAPQIPCPDVYWFPVFNDRFCDEFVAEAENFGKWSTGTNTDDRLTGGYEAVPTRDIHMNQIGYDEEWLYLLNMYIRPLQESVYLGYTHNPPRSIMNFIVRYRPDEQPNLRPHHDSSTYTINVALNNVGTDYEGGGCQFLRYNCKVTETRKGWILMHPGRLTHYHEGLTVTKGTRYIMISFIDP